MKELVPGDMVGSVVPHLGDDEARRTKGAPWIADAWAQVMDESVMNQTEEGTAMDVGTDGRGRGGGERTSPPLDEARGGGDARDLGSDPRGVHPVVRQVGLRRFVDNNILKSLKKITKQARGLDPDIEARILQLVRAGTRAVGVVLRDRIEGLGEIVVRVTQTPHGVSVLLRGAISDLAPVIRSTLVEHGIRVVEVRGEDRERRSLKQEREGLDALA